MTIDFRKSKSDHVLGDYRHGVVRRARDVET